MKVIAAACCSGRRRLDCVLELVLVHRVLVRLTSVYSRNAFLSYGARDARESHSIVRFNAESLCNVSISAS